MEKTTVCARNILLTVAALLLAVTTCAQSRGNPEDEAAIKNVIQSGNTDTGGSRFAADVVWTNAFGRRLHGRQETARFLDELHHDPNYTAGQTAAGSETIDLHFVRPDVAVVHEFFAREGQIDSTTGKAMPTRKIHVQFVLSKEQGRWLIQSELIMDEKL